VARLRAVDCRQFIQAVTEKAEEIGAPVAIAIVNSEGHVLAIERMDDAGFISPDMAKAKAFTVAAWRSISPRFQDGLVIQKWFQERNPQLLMNASVLTNGQVYVSGGCAPVFIGDEMVGAYGIAGGTSDEDEAMGVYAREKLGWKHVPENDPMKASQKAHINEIYAKSGIKGRDLK
jgi:glc operon protein GlcG